MRANQELGMGNVKEASKFYGKVLNMAPENAAAWFGNLLCDYDSTSDTELIYKINNATFDNSDILFDLSKNGNYLYATKYADDDIRERLSQVNSAIANKVHDLCTTVSKDGNDFYQKVIDRHDNSENYAEALYSKLLCSYKFKTTDKLLDAINNAASDNIKSYSILFSIDNNDEFLNAISGASPETTERLLNINNAAKARISELVRNISDNSAEFYKKVMESKTNVSLDYKYAQCADFLLNNGSSSAEELTKDIDKLSAKFKNFERLFVIKSRIEELLDECKKDKKQVIKFESANLTDKNSCEKEYDTIIKQYKTIDNACINKIAEIKTAEPDYFKTEIEKNKADIESLQSNWNSENEKLKKETEAVAPYKKKREGLERKCKYISTSTVTAEGYDIWDAYDVIPGVFVPVPAMFSAVKSVGGWFADMWEGVWDHEDFIFALFFVFAAIGSVFVGIAFVGVLFVALVVALVCTAIFVAITLGFVIATIAISIAFIFEKIVRCIFKLRDCVLNAKIAKISKIIDEYDERIRYAKNNMQTFENDIYTKKRYIEQMTANINMLEKA